MSRKTWLSLAVIAAIGWTGAGLLALTFASYVGWIGIFILGLIVLLITVSADLNADHPAHLPSAHLTAELHRRTTEGTREERLSRFADRIERNRGLYVARTFGIALALLGLGMFMRHQV